MIHWIAFIRERTTLLHGCAFICLLSLVAGLGSNLLRASPLPLIPPFLTGPSIPEIDPTEAREWIREGKGFLLDSRAHGQFQRSRIPGALSLPPKDFPALFPAVNPLLPPNRWIIVYGQGWGRPTEREVAYLLHQAGKGQIRILKGGFQAWQAKGLRVRGR